MAFNTSHETSSQTVAGYGGRSGRAAFTPGELAQLTCGFALLGDRSPEVSSLLDAVAGNVVRRVKVTAAPPNSLK